MVNIESKIGRFGLDVRFVGNPGPWTPNPEPYILDPKP